MHPQRGEPFPDRANPSIHHLHGIKLCTKLAEFPEWCLAPGTGGHEASCCCLHDWMAASVCKSLLGCFGVLPALGSGHRGTVELLSIDQGQCVLSWGTPRLLQSKRLYLNHCNRTRTRATGHLCHFAIVLLFDLWGSVPGPGQLTQLSFSCYLFPS